MAQLKAWQYGRYFLSLRERTKVRADFMFSAFSFQMEIETKVRA
jgi:hypothetical protein